MLRKSYGNSTTNSPDQYDTTQAELRAQSERLARTELELRELRDHYADLCDRSPVGLLTISDDGTIDEINLTCSLFFRADRGMLLRRDFASLVSPNHQDLWHQHLALLLKSNHRELCELSLQLDDGVQILAKLDCLRLQKTSSQATIRIVMTCMTQDINSNVVSAAFEMQESLMITDADSVILKVNHEFTKATGYTSEEVVGKTPRILQSGMHNADFYDAMWACIRKTGVWHGAVWDKKKNGDIHQKWLTISAIRGPNDEITHYVGSHVDVTEMSDARIAAEKESRNKSEFISKIAHELRTPLNSIIGYTQLIEHGSPPPTPGQLSRLKEILRGGWHLLELINETTNLESIESNKMPLLMEHVSLHEIFHECKAMLEPQARLHDITIHTPQSKNSMFIYSDRVRVKQILINLMSNAIKYNRNAGRVDVSCSTHIPGKIQVSVKDSGEGLSSRDIAQLFQPFNRLKQENNGIEGTGLGLVLTKRLIELMGGKIGVTSTVGEGSVFWFNLNING